VYRCQVIEYADGGWRPLGGWKWEAVGLAVTVADDRRVDVVGRDVQVCTVLDGRSTETRLTAAGAVRGGCCRGGAGRLLSVAGLEVWDPPTEGVGGRP
jgi:hypothetical protein